jgi:hypothetical protein
MKDKTTRPKENKTFGVYPLYRFIDRSKMADPWEADVSRKQ